MKIRVWYQWNGKVDSCKVDARSKAEAKKILQEALPSAIIGYIQKA